MAAFVFLYFACTPSRNFSAEEKWVQSALNYQVLSRANLEQLAVDRSSKQSFVSCFQEDLVSESGDDTQRSIEQTWSASSPVWYVSKGPDAVCFAEKMDTNTVGIFQCTARALSCWRMQEFLGPDQADSTFLWLGSSFRENLFRNRTSVLNSCVILAASDGCSHACLQICKWKTFVPVLLCSFPAWYGCLYFSSRFEDIFFETPVDAK